MSTKYEEVKELNLKLEELFYLGKKLIKLSEDEYDLWYELHNIVSILQNEETRDINFYNGEFKESFNKIVNEYYHWYTMQGFYLIDIIKSYVKKVDVYLDMYIDYRGDLEFKECLLHGKEVPHMKVDDKLHCMICLGGDI